MKSITILGSTGSIGTQALEVADICGNVRINGLTCHSNVTLFEQQIRRYKPQKACIVNKELYPELKALCADLTVELYAGEEGLCEVATNPETDAVLTSVVGNVGLVPTVEAINAGKDILLANKETLVTSGEIIMPLAKEKGVSILPVDSEHSAIFQCLQGKGDNGISKILLTASGGPFFGKTKSDLKNVTRENALAHPNWSMGAKITIDSATMMNKGLEVIEARWLFDVMPEDIEVYIHRQSIVHSMVEFCDNSVIAQLGIPDMKLPIVYAMQYPDRSIPVNKRLNLFDVHTLTFDKPDTETFECLSIAYDALSQGGTMPAVMNAANEVAVAHFLDGRVEFLQIPEIIKKTMDAHKPAMNFDLDDVLKADKWAREFSEELTLAD